MDWRDFRKGTRRDFLSEECDYVNVSEKGIKNQCRNILDTEEMWLKIKALLTQSMAEKAERCKIRRVTLLIVILKSNFIIY